MMNKFALTLYFVVILLMSASVMAQDNTADQNYQQKVSLAQKMHQIRPMNVQIEDAVKRLSLRYPEEKRALFVSKMVQTFDSKALTELSVNAMAETFTVAELEKMIDFHGSAEGKAITEKTPVYQSIVTPELVKKIDKALMEVRMGKTAN